MSSAPRASRPGIPFASRRAGLVLMILAALAVRVQNLTYHSLWFDEAMSVHWARSEIARIMEVSMQLVEDRLPPLYYLLLHGWRLLVGDGDFVVRLPSVFLGVLLVPVVYRLAAELYDRRDPTGSGHAPTGSGHVATLSAALVALNPFLVWYGQETRMYTLAVLLATLGTWCFLRAVWRTRPQVTTGAHAQRDGTHRWLLRGLRDSLRGGGAWVAYGLCVLAGLYTHFYTGFLVPAHAAYLLLTWHTRRRGASAGTGSTPWIPFAATLLVVAVLFAPLALAAARASGEAGAGEPLSGLGVRLWSLLAAFTVWKAPLEPSTTAVVAGLMGALALVGLWPGRGTPSCRWRQRGTWDDGDATIAPLKRGWEDEVPAARSLLALLLLTPPVLGTLLLVRSRLAFFGERYFIIMLPWFLMAVALGAVRLSDWVRPAGSAARIGKKIPRRLGDASRGAVAALCCLLPLVLTTIPLPGQWSPPARKEAWRETAAHLAQYARAEDAILIHPDWTRYPLQYYFGGPGQTYAVFSAVGKHSDLDGPLTAISQQHPVVWLVESHTETADPQHRVNGWLAARFPLVTELYPPGLAVRAYAPGYLTAKLPEFATPTAISFGVGLRMAGYLVPDTHIRAGDDLFHPPSGWVHATTWWVAETPLGQDYVPFVHMVDALGQVWGASLERPNDTFHVYPPTRWQPLTQVVRADFDVNLNPVAPPGAYRLVVGLLDAAGVTQLPLTDGTVQATMAEVEIVE